MGISASSVYSFLPASLIISLIFSFTPYITRKSEAFGVSIPTAEYNNSTLISLRRRYRNFGLLLGVIILALLLGVYHTKAVYILSNIIVAIQLVSFFLLYLWFYKQAKAFKASQNWEKHMSSKIAVDISPAGHSYISSAWLLLFPAVMAFTAMLGFALYPAAPERIATHWNFAGVAGGWVDKSYGIIWFTLVMQLFQSGLMCFVFYITKNARRQIDADHIEESAKRVNLFRRGWGYFTISMGVILNLSFTLTLLGMLGALDIKVIIALLITGFVLIMVGAGWLVIKIGQGGSRIKIPKEDGGYISVRDDDHYWKLGTIYYNPNDPAIFVEKRFGIGWTCNFARPMSWVLLIGLFVFIGIMSYIPRLLIK
ncbi:DUF5808 domain-containing protein [Oscillospiraceae bacterium PP1C4]